MYLWRRRASEAWLSTREESLQARFGSWLSITSMPDRRRIEIEIACPSKTDAHRLVCELGGRAEKLSRDWLRRFIRAAESGRLRIGRRLIVFSGARKKEGVSPESVRSPNLPYILVIPAGVAFGTGEHATTAMSLRLLEQLVRGWRPGWSLVDLGTGSGILALAARKLGAGEVVGIDIDPITISTARSNLRANKLHGVQFLVGDARFWKPPGRIDILIANLFSELLIELLPKFKCAKWLILSGILRAQEQEIVCGLQQYHIDIVKIRRRGKWIAILARESRPGARTGSSA
ncbi:MAG TPA: 50S ribosomal protein L11 methyltransferase [Candidatus Acidoferrum sp.]|nr:50S ribosomal protein L11 methyltransferase [Candidatus Acidoferrum sp.]